MLLLCTEIHLYMNFWQYKSKLQMHLPQCYQLIILIAYQIHSKTALYCMKKYTDIYCIAEH